MFDWLFGRKPKTKVQTESVELTEEDLDVVVGGGKYDLHGKGYNSGKSSPFKGKNTNDGEF